jgi:hypothetical protein
MCQDVGNASRRWQTSGVIPLRVSNGVHGRNKLSVDRKRPSEASGIDHPRVGFPGELPCEEPGEVGGVRQPFDRPLPDAVSREQDRV